MRRLVSADEVQQSIGFRPRWYGPDMAIIYDDSNGLFWLIDGPGRHLSDSDLERYLSPDYPLVPGENGGQINSTPYFKGMTDAQLTFGRNKFTPVQLQIVPKEGLI